MIRQTRENETII